jgi:hypothetical protein
MRSIHRFSFPLLIAAAAALLPLVAFAGDADQRAARIVTTARTIEWRAPTDRAASALSILSVQRPDGEVITETFAAGRNPMLRIDGLADGQYSYELRMPQTDSVPRVETGSFTLAHGAIIPPTTLERHLRPTGETLFSDFVSARGAASAPAPIAPARRRSAAQRRS